MEPSRERVLTVGPAAAVRMGYPDVAVVCDRVVGIDFDLRVALGEDERELRVRCIRALREYGLRGAIVERTGTGYTSTGWRFSERCCRLSRNNALSIRP